jgi:hypothetical protein
VTCQHSKPCFFARFLIDGKCRSAQTSSATIRRFVIAEYAGVGFASAAGDECQLRTSCFETVTALFSPMLADEQRSWLVDQLGTLSLPRAAGGQTKKAADGDHLIVREDALWVDEPSGPRWVLALELLARGDYVVCMGLGLTLATETPPEPHRPGQILTVRVQTRRPDSLTAEHALTELENAEAGLDEIRQRSPAFAALVADREPLFELIDDDGTGSVRLAFKDRTGFHFTKA